MVPRQESVFVQLSQMAMPHTPHSSLFGICRVLHCQSRPSKAGILINIDVGWDVHRQLAQWPLHVHSRHGLYTRTSSARRRRHHLERDLGRNRKRSRPDLGEAWGSRCEAPARRRSLEGGKQERGDGLRFRNWGCDAASALLPGGVEHSRW